MKKLVLLATISMFIYSSAFAGGFQLNEQGARALAMGGAFTGLANDPSALYFNPAGITQLKGTNFYLGTTLIMPLATYKAPGATDSKYEQVSQTFTPVNFYLTHAFSDKVSVGVSLNNQYGLGTKWQPDWPGKYLAVDTELETYFTTAAVALKLSDNFSISAGGVFAFGNVKIARKQNVTIPNPLAPGTFLNLGDVTPTMEGDGTAFEFTAGLLYKPTDNLQLGASYRSEASFDLSGTVSTIPSQLSVGPVVIPIADQNISSTLVTPQNITVGLAFMPKSNLTLTADFQYVGWSSYDKLEVTNSDNGAIISSVKRDYQNTFIARAGVEYSVGESFQLRGGVLYDHNPVKDELVEPTLPDADRIGLCLGYGTKISEHFGIDVSYFLLLFADRSVSKSEFGFNGTYSTTAHLFGVNLSYSL